MASFCDNGGGDEVQSGMFSPSISKDDDELAYREWPWENVGVTGEGISDRPEDEAIVLVV